MIVRLSIVSSKIGYKHKICILTWFRAYVWQPDDHIGWAISLPFVSIYPTNPRTNSSHFHEKKRIVRIEELTVFELAILIFFCFIPMKISQSFLGSKDGSKLLWLPWFPLENHLKTVLTWLFMLLPSSKEHGNGQESPYLAIYCLSQTFNLSLKNVTIVLPFNLGPNWGCWKKVRIFYFHPFLWLRQLW